MLIWLYNKKSDYYYDLYKLYACCVPICSKGIFIGLTILGQPTRLIIISQFIGQFEK